MANSDLPIIGKTIADVAFFSDDETPWEVEIKFTDGTFAFIGGSKIGTVDLLSTEDESRVWPIRREILS